MKQIIAKLYITIITLLILLGMAYLYNEIRLSRGDYKFESQNVLKEAKTLIENNWFKNKNFTSQSLNDELESFMNKTPDLHSIIIYSKDEGLKVVSSRYRDRSFLLNSFTADDPNWNSSPEYSFNRWDKIENNLLSSPLQISKHGYSFDIIYNVLSKEKIKDVLESAIVAIIILFVLTVIVIILFSTWKNKYTDEGLEEDPFKAISPSTPATKKKTAQVIDEIEKHEALDTGSDFDELDDFDVGGSDSLDDLEDFDLGSDSQSSDIDDLEDFSLDMDTPEQGTSTETDELDDLEDFSIGFDEQEEKTEYSDSLEDFDLDFEEPVAGAEEANDLEDFDLDFEEAEAEEMDESETIEEVTDELEDFDLDFEEAETEEMDESETIEEVTDELEDFDLDFEDTETEEMDESETIEEVTDELEDFDLDFEGTEAEEIDESETIEEVTDELEDFDLDFEDTETEDVSDELEDFDLDFEETEPTEEEVAEINDDLENFDLDFEETEATKEETSETIDEIEDFGLDFEDSETVTEEETSEIVDFDLDLESEEVSLETEESEDELEKSIEEIDALEDLEHEIEEEDQETEEVEEEIDSIEISIEDNVNESTEPETSEEEDEYNLSDYAIDSDDENKDFNLDEFSLENEEEPSEDISDMDLSPETIEASALIDELPDMEIEEDVPVRPKSDFKTKEIAGPELSSLLEKAGVAENDLSIAVLGINDEDAGKYYDFIKDYYSENDNIYEIENNQIAIAFNELDSNAAITELNTMLEEARSQGLNINAGISSMNGRRVGENRLMGEAISALNKAKDETKELLAFRPDPNKYKEYIKNS